MSGCPKVSYTNVAKFRDYGCYFIVMCANMYIAMYVMSNQVKNVGTVLFRRYASKYVHSYVCDEYQKKKFQNTWTRLYFIDIHANTYMVMNFKICG